MKSVGCLDFMHISYVTFKPKLSFITFEQKYVIVMFTA